MGKNMRRVVALIIAALSVMMSGCNFIPVEEELPAAPIIYDYEVKTYTLTAVLRGDMIKTDTIKCKYQAIRTEDYGFELGSEYIGGVYVTEGQAVKKGELMAELAQNNLNQQITNREGQISILKMKISHLQEDRRLALNKQDALIARTESQLQSVQELISQLEEWEAEMEAWKQAVKEWESQQTPPAETEGNAEGEENVTQPVEDEVQTPTPPKPEEPVRPTEKTMEELQREETTLLTQKTTQQTQRTSSAASYDEQIQSLQDTLYVQELRLKEEKENLKVRQIYATFDGTVTFVEEIKDGQKSEKNRKFITVTDTSAMVYTVTGNDAKYFTPGMKVQISYDETVLDAEVITAEQFGYAQEDGSKKIAYLQLLESNLSFEDGASGTITLTLEESLDTLMVDSDAVKSSNGQPIVYMLNEDGLRVMQEVTTGMVYGDYTEILSGLKEGDKVILN